VSAGKNSIVLFDMDGTLTAARKKVDMLMITSLAKLSKFADIGIVTGSPMMYLEQQCGDLWAGTRDDHLARDISLFPCNGTLSYSYSPDKNQWVINSSTNMRAHIGNENYGKLIREILSIQSNYADRHHDLPVTGNFISDRKSMINWCPVGRDADTDQRIEFQEFDKKYRCRSCLKKDFEGAMDYLGIPDITCALGGDTSIDIYPSGWDKTYVLRHTKSYDTVYFVGDRCDVYGNDKTLYEALSPGITSFKTSGPDNTIVYIDKLIDILSKEQ
jgi:phosphomannomutase